jgi:16S rRNA (uracil1498-N3)-methyltransferase
MSRHIPRIFTPQTLVTQGSISLTGKGAHHVMNVLRLEAGDLVHLFNGEDGEWSAKIWKTHKREVVLTVHLRVRPPETPSLLTLFFPLIKPARLEWMIEKGTELGVTDFLPFRADYGSHKQGNVERLEAIAQSAAEQSGRLTLPRLGSLKTLQDHLTLWQQRVQTSALFWGDPASQMSLLEAVHAQPLPSARGFLIGPEGGWSPSECDWLQSHASILKPTSLGPTILRAETAAILGLGVLSVVQ